MKRLFVIPLMIVLVSGLIFGGCAAPAPAPAPAAPTPGPTPTPVPGPAAVPTPPEEVIELKFAHEMPAECSQHKDKWVPWTQDIEKATDGRVKITIFPGESLGPTDTYIEGVASGMMDIAWISLEFFEGRWPLSMVGYLPIGVKTAGTLAHVYWDLYKELPEIQAEFPNMKVLALYGGSPKQIYTGERYKNDVRTIADVKGMKIKVGGGLFNDAVEALDGAPVSIPAPGMYEALQKGTIDGSWFELGDGVEFLLQEVCRSVTVINAPGCGFALIMNPDSYAKMTPKDRLIFDSLCGDSYIDRAANIYYRNDMAAEETLTKAGVEVIHPASAEYAEFEEAISTIVDNWLTMTLGKPADKVLQRAKELSKIWEARGWWK